MEYLWPIIVASFWGPMLLHFKKSNEILETWSPHCKNLAFKDPPSLNFHNRTDANKYHIPSTYQWSVNQYLGIGKYLFILQISIMYRFMENSLISISMLSIKKYILIYWYFQYFTVPFLKSHESLISRVFMKFHTHKASSAHLKDFLVVEN